MHVLSEQEKSRAVLIGMNNPLSGPPLHPDPPGCTGHRIWQMLRAGAGEVSKLQYVAAFERVNACPDRLWDPLRCGEVASDLAGGRWADRTVLILGTQAARALGVGPRSWITPQRLWGCVLRLVPHPSGLNRWYNDDENRVVVETLLAELYFRHADVPTTSELCV